MTKLLPTLLALAVVWAVAPDAAQAELITFSPGDSFDGNVAGDVAGPFSSTGGWATAAINGATSPSAPPSLNTTVFGMLSVDSGNGGTDSLFWESGESWTFSWEQDAQFRGIDFALFTGNESFTLQSSAFVGFTPAGSLGSNVSLDNIAGTFTFTGAPTNGSFDLNDLGGSGVNVGAGTLLTLSYNGDFAVVQSFTTTPEPGAGLMTSVGLVLLGLKRRRR